MEISVSILNLKDKSKLPEIEKSKPEMIHLDIMDGNFVSEVSDFDLEYLNEYNYDIHLMVNNPTKYIEKFEVLNPKYITFHIEIGKTKKYIKKIKKISKVGIAINPETDVESLYPYLKDIDLVLVMSVNPGRGGQEFLMSSIFKIEELYKYREKNNLNFKISVDGGVNDFTIKYLNMCDIVVAGSFITSGNYDEKIRLLKEL